jgi:hypothetical protein
MTTTTEIKQFNKTKSEIAKVISTNQFDSVKTESVAELVKGNIKSATEIKKGIEATRVELKKPYLEAGAAIDEIAKELTLPLDQFINQEKSKILSFEQEKERKRLEDLRIIEDRRKAREAEERKEKERVETINRKLISFEQEGIRSIQSAETVASIDKVISSIKMYSISETAFMEFLNAALSTKKALLDKAALHRIYLISREDQQKEAARLDGIAKEQAELKTRQDEQARKLREESERIDREKRDLELKKQQDARERDRIAAQAREDISLREKQKELSSQKMKNVRKNWEFEILNLEEIPREYLVLDDKKVRQAIHSGIRNIPGLRIYQADLVVVR